jgi:hypothetical protein
VYRAAYRGKYEQIPHAYWASKWEIFLVNQQKIW